MNLIDLRTEVLDRGFSYMGDDSAGEARVNRWVNLAYQEICNADDWPFLRATATGRAPLVISDLATVQFVQSTLDGIIYPADERDLRDAYENLTVTGPAMFYYLTPYIRPVGPQSSEANTPFPGAQTFPGTVFPGAQVMYFADSASYSAPTGDLDKQTQINTYPLTANAIFVVYTKVPSDLSADSDTPIIPERFHYAIVEYACARAYLDNDNPVAAQVCRQEGDRIVFQMRDHLTPQQHQRSGFITRYGSDDG